MAQATTTAPGVKPPQMWGARISTSFNLWKQRAWPLAQQLEDSLSGVFPTCVQGAPTLKPDQSGLWSYADADQVNHNLNLAATQYMVAQSWDEYPSLHFANRPRGASEELIVGTETLATTIMDDGDATGEFRTGMVSCMCRGPLVLFYGIGGETPTAQGVASLGAAAAAVVNAVMQGQDVTLKPGMNFEAVAAAARALAGDPAKAATLGIVNTGRLLALAQSADSMLEKEQATAPRTERAKVWFQACPYGSWALWDPTVSDPRKAAWVARKLVYDDEEFQACEAFSAKAKAEVKPIEVGVSDGWGQVKYAAMDAQAAGIENKRFVIWEIWDRRHWKVHYIAEGYDEFLEEDDTYPYMDQHGKPLLPGFFPCVIRTPIKSPRERPEAAYGVAQLAPGWPMQIEFIKFESKAVNSLKQTARIFKAGAGVDEAEFQAVKSGVDGTIVKMKPATGQKEDAEFSKLPFDTPAPADYQNGAMRCMFRYATAVRVPSVAFTGEPIADTLGQEQIALTGSTVTVGDITRQYESAYAEAAWGSLMLFRAFAPDEQVQAYLGPTATEPRQQPMTDSTGQPVIDPMTGQPAVQMLPSLWDEWKAVSLDGYKFQARFASTTRAEDLAAQKMALDYLVAQRGGVTPMGMRLWDETDTMNRLAKMMDMPEPKPYQPSFAEQAAMVMQGGGAGVGKKPGEDREGPSGERTDSRTAGGQRGDGKGIKGRQERHRGPQTDSNIRGNTQRPKTATA